MPHTNVNRFSSALSSTNIRAATRGGVKIPAFVQVLPLLVTLVASGSAGAADYYFGPTSGSIPWSLLPFGGFVGTKPGIADRGIYDQGSGNTNVVADGGVGQMVYRGSYTGTGFAIAPAPFPSAGMFTLYGVDGVGIDSQVNQQIIVSGRATLGASQEWRINSASGSIRQWTDTSTVARPRSLILGVHTLTLNPVNAANLFDLDTPISGTGGLVAKGAGSVRLNAANTYTGGTAMNGGVVEVTSDDNLGDAAGTLSFDGGTLRTKGSFAMNRATTFHAGGGTLETDAGTTLVQNAAMGGAGGLRKTGAGRLELTGINTYAGATTIGAGTLALTGAGSIAESRDVRVDGIFDITGIAAPGSAIKSLSGGGTVAMGAKHLDITAADGSFAGSLGGTGSLTLRGGHQVLSGNNGGFTGTAFVDAGTLSVNGVLGGVVNVVGGRLQGTGSVGDTTNFAGGTIAPGNSIGTLLIAGNYVGNGGTLEIEGVFGGTGSPADRLVITGNASGTTTIQTINTGGAGALTGSGNTDGISIVQVGGTSTADAFALAGGYAAAGPYQYQLRMFDAASSAVGEADPLLGAVPFYDYRLQSVVDASGNPVAVPQIAGYQAMPTGAVRYGAALLDSVHKRQGELRDLAGAARASNSEQRDPAFFARANGSRNDVAGHHASGYDQNIGYLQVGGHVLGREMEDGATLRIGGAFSHGQSKLEAAASSARVDLRGTTFALISTYQTAAGWYLDGAAQLTDYNASIQTRERGRVGSPDGLGLGLSVEGGYPIDIGGGLVIEPQAQLSYQKIKFDRFVDVDGIAVDLQGGESLRGRVGGRIKKAFNTNTTRQWTLYAEGNLVHEFLKDRGIRTSGVTFASDSLGTSAQVGGGIQAQLGANTALFASVSYSKGLSKSAADAWSGNVGLRVGF